MKTYIKIVLIICIPIYFLTFSPVSLCASNETDTVTQDVCNDSVLDSSNTEAHNYNINKEKNINTDLSKSKSSFFNRKPSKLNIKNFTIFSIICLAAWKISPEFFMSASLAYLIFL